MEGVTEVKAKIIECVGLIINNWSVVQLALDHGWVSKNHKRMKESEEAAEFSKVKKLNETEDDVKQRFITELSDFIYGKE